MNGLWEEIIGNIDERFINETVDFHTRNTPCQRTLVSEKIDFPAPADKRKELLHAVLKIAAAFAVIIGIGTVLKINDFSLSEMIPQLSHTEMTTTGEDTAPLDAIEEKHGFDILGNNYTSEDGLFHVSMDEWEVCDDYELFRKYFFGVWVSGNGYELVIDDSEKADIGVIHDMHFLEFYAVGDNVLAFMSGGSAGTVTYWVDMNNPQILYNGYGRPGGFPHGFASNDKGEPICGTMTKTNAKINEPSDNYMSVYKLREMSAKYGIDFALLVDFGIPLESGTQYHDSLYYFNPMYLVSESENRLEFITNTSNGATVYEGAKQAEVKVILEKINGRWIRTVELVAY